MNERPPLVRSPLQWILPTLFFALALSVVTAWPIQQAEAQSNGQLRCGSSTIIQRYYRFGFFGFWLNYTTCGYGCYSYSNSASCRCPGGYPSPGTQTCSGNNILTCNYSTSYWGSYSASYCQYGCFQSGSTFSCRCSTGYPNPGGSSCSGTYAYACGVTTSRYGAPSSTWCYRGCYIHTDGQAYCRCMDGVSTAGQQYCYNNNYRYSCTAVRTAYNYGTYLGYCSYGCAKSGSTAYCRCWPYGNYTGTYFCSGTTRYLCGTGTGSSGSYSVNNCPAGTVCNAAQPTTGQCISVNCRDTVTGITYNNGTSFCGTGNLFSNGQTPSTFARYTCSNGVPVYLGTCSYGCYMYNNAPYCKCNQGHTYLNGYCSGNTRYMCNLTTAPFGSYASYFCSYGCALNGTQTYCKCLGGTSAGGYFCSGVNRYQCRVHAPNLNYTAGLSALAVCAGDEVCSFGQCIASSTSCSYLGNFYPPGEFCYNNNRMRCSNRTVTTLGTCFYGCAVSSGTTYCKCVGGVDVGGTYCSGNSRYTCARSTASGGSGTFNNTCTYGCYSYVGAAYCRCIGSTSNGQQYCSGNSRYTCTLSTASIPSGTLLGTCNYGCYLYSGTAYCRCPGGLQYNQGLCGSGTYTDWRVLCALSTAPNGGESPQNKCTYGCYISGGLPYCKCAGGRTAGQGFCSTTTTRAFCTLSTLSGGSMTTSSCWYGCYISGTSPYCKCAGGRTDGMEYCNGNYVYRCTLGTSSSSAWYGTSIVYCNNGCALSGTTPYCRCTYGKYTGQFFCSGTTRLQCSIPANLALRSSYPGGYAIVNSCPTGTICNVLLPSGGLCVSSICTNGRVTYNTNQTFCGDNTWYGSVFTRASYIYICINGRVSLVSSFPCTYGCYPYLGGAYCRCPGGYTVGQQFCSGATALYQCNLSTASGGNYTRVGCGLSQICQNNRCIISTCTYLGKTYNNGQTFCNGKTRMICFNSTVTAQGVCGYTCYEYNSAAYCSCPSNTQGGQYFCQGSVRYLCQFSTSAFGSSAPSPCPNNQFCSGAGSCTACTCTTGTLRCGVTGKDIEVCQNCTTWVRSTACAANQFCLNGTCNACVCSPGTTRCAGLSIETCRSDCSGWTLSQTCTASQYCDPATTRCAACTCTPGTQKCNGNIVERCDTNCLRWYSYLDCTKQNAFCSVGQCTNCTCTPGTLRCNGNDIEKCNTDCGTWSKTSSCNPLGSPGTYCSAGACQNCSCKPGDVRCFGAEVQDCNASCQWVTKQKCASGQFCFNNQCSSCQCAPGSTRCSQNAAGADIIEQCDAGCQNWSTQKTCVAGSERCIFYNNTSQCAGLNWCPNATAPLAVTDPYITPICNNKICYQNKCTAWDCTDASHCKAGQICTNNQCTNAACNYANTTGIFDTACVAKTPTKPYCAVYQCRSCRYDYKTGQKTPECQQNGADGEYCAQYECRQCPTNPFTAHAECANIRGDYRYCVEYKCAQCPTKWNPSDSTYCSGLPCKDYFCAQCNNGSTTPKWDAKCAADSPGTPYCSQYKCVECPETNSLSAICQGKYSNKGFCSATNICVQCPGTGFSSFCQNTYKQDYCYNGVCQECGSDSMTKDDTTCKSLYGQNKPNCFKYKCVECPNDSPIGTYDRDYCSIKYGNATPAKNYCASNVCVECPDQTKTKTTSCPASTPICQNYKCYQCIDNSDCPIGDICQSNQCKSSTQQCGSCSDDNFCASNMTTGMNCGVGKKRCNPKNSTCVQCLVDTDCAVGERCDLANNTCTKSNCPTFCTTNADCNNIDCGVATRCIKNACTPPPATTQCASPNLLMIIDESCSMGWPRTYGWVNTGKPCSSAAQCTAMFNTQIPSYSPKFEVACTSGTCYASRWDVAMSSLLRVMNDYGGTAPLYTDRRARWGLEYFSSGATLVAGISDIPNTAAIINSLKTRSPGGGTNYVAGFTTAENHLKVILPADPIPNRKTALIFVTDGDPNEGCAYTQSPSIVDRIYNWPTPLGTLREIKTYAIGFGSGLSTSGKNCLATLARYGHTTPQSCTSATCLGFYVADTAADIANALQDVINAATQEVCDGLDNDCDGMVDNNTTDACSCVMSFSRPTPTTTLDPTSADFRAGIRLYTFVASFDIQGSCPISGTAASSALKVYIEACRNDPQKATTCSPDKTSLPNPAGDAFGYYCRRCCGDGTVQGTCSWPTSHTCNTKPWGANACQVGCIKMCKGGSPDPNYTIKQLAMNCLMPKGLFVRTGTGYDKSGDLQVLTTKEFGEEVLNKQSQRWIFINRPDVDHRTQLPDDRPLIASVSPDFYQSPTPSGTAWQTPSGWDNRYKFSSSNPELNYARLGINVLDCTDPVTGNITDCVLDREESIWFLLGYSESTGKSLRINRMSAMYHSTPAVVNPVRTNIPDPGFEAWVQEKIPAGSFNNFTVRDRPSTVYVGTADGIMHAFNVSTGVEIWGFIPGYFLQSNARERLREAANGRRLDGTRIHMTDGSPVAQDIQMYRYVDNTGNVRSKWRTMLLFGLRSGGRAYVAIDVTNPYVPRLLWEISDQTYLDPNNRLPGTTFKLALTFAEPYVANVLLDFKGRRQERAIAFLPGGLELKRPNIVWEIDYGNTAGSLVYAVDLETGEYITELPALDLAAGITASLARGVAAAPIGYSVPPAISTRVFFGDILGRIFRADIQDPDPKRWSVKLFFNLFTATETSRPIMTAPSLALNERGEVVLYGGTGDLEDIDNKAKLAFFDKVYSLRERISSTGTGVAIDAIPNYITKLDKIISGELDPTKKPYQYGPQQTSASNTNELLTGPPVIFAGTAYFTTYAPTGTTLPICGVVGSSRIYGIQFNDGCHNKNCEPLSRGAAGGISHYYQKVLAFVDQSGSNQSHTPLKYCERSPGVPWADSDYQAAPFTTCGDLNYTVPMLAYTATTTPYEYFRYFGMGANTLAMGVTFAYQPGETSITRTANPDGSFGGHSYQSTRPGRQYLTFQVAGKNVATESSWKLDSLRAVKIPASATDQRGALATIGTIDSASPLTIHSWGQVLD